MTSPPHYAALPWSTFANTITNPDDAMVANKSHGESFNEKQAAWIDGIALAPLRKEAPTKREGDWIKNVALPP